MSRPSLGVHSFGRGALALHDALFELVEHLAREHLVIEASHMDGPVGYRGRPVSHRQFLHLRHPRGLAPGELGCPRLAAGLPRLQ